MVSKLEKIRLEKGLSQNRLAEISGVHQQTISLIERGRPIRNLPQVQKLANALGCNPSDLIDIDSKYDKMSGSDLKNIHKFLQATIELSGSNIRQTANLLNLSAEEFKDLQDETTTLSVEDGLLFAFVSLFPFVSKHLATNIKQGQIINTENAKEKEVLEAFRSLTEDEQERFIHLIKATPLLR